MAPPPVQTPGTAEAERGGKPESGKKKKSVFQSMSFLPVGGSLGSCVRFQIERVSNGICLSFGRISFSMGVFLTICGAASGIFLTLFVAEYTSTVYMDILYPTQPSVHVH